MGLLFAFSALDFLPVRCDFSISYTFSARRIPSALALFLFRTGVLRRFFSSFRDGDFEIIPYFFFNPSSLFTSIPISAL